MYSFGQWLHQHDLVLLGVGIVAATGLLPLLRRRSPRSWLLWLGVTGLTLAGLFSLRTSNASVTEHAGPEPEPLETQLISKLLYSEPHLKSEAHGGRGLFRLRHWLNDSVFRRERDWHIVGSGSSRSAERGFGSESAMGRTGRGERYAELPLVQSVGQGAAPLDLPGAGTVGASGRVSTARGKTERGSSTEMCGWLTAES